MISVYTDTAAPVHPPCALNHSRQKVRLASTSEAHTACAARVDDDDWNAPHPLPPCARLLLNTSSATRLLP
eukprot:scaffold3454_cov68-Phaeocystis_antarctica.AAC.2